MKLPRLGSNSFAGRSRLKLSSLQWLPMKVAVELMRH